MGKIKLFTAAFLITCLVQSICTSQIRFKDSLFNSVKITKDVKFGENKNYLGVTKSLLLDFYEPENDTLPERPLMIWVHGGSFLLGSKEDTDVSKFCIDFAKKGYVTSSINYRLGLLPFGTSEYYKAVIRAVQDLKAAIRFFRANKSQYKIDDNLIIVGGTSAGAFTALHAAYLNSNEIPSLVDTTQLGGLEGNSGNPGYSTKFNLVLNCWGAIGDTNWIQPDDIPIMSEHGTDDSIVPCYEGNAMGTVHCFGSVPIHNTVERLGIKNKLRLWEGLEHGLYDNDFNLSKARYDTLVAGMSDFVYGTIFASPSDVHTDESIPEDFVLFQNYPNPFNAETIISWQAPKSGSVTIKLYDILGNEILNLFTGSGSTGINKLNFNAANLASGIYYYKIQSDYFSQTKKLMILK
ncbi:MAG: T9SS C-terminal target domain-containing protein [Ignavibacteriales bacterium]|nr:MAG: T9SS C-terminal target domain-containing protein [Ignavibacteriales bacterium]